MSGSSRKINCGQMIIGSLAVVAMLWICGCGDFFDKKDTELETRRTLNELSRVREIPDVNNPLPDMYRGPAKRLKVKDGVKLFYFTKNHVVEKLSGLIKSQLGVKVDISGPTNQLIIHCSNDEEADKVLEFLTMVDVPPIQVNIDCLILERYADVTMDWETTLMIENLFGEDFALGGKIARDSDGVIITDVYENAKLLPTFPGASLRESKRSEFGLKLDYFDLKDKAGHQFRAVVDILISKGYLKILMNPTLQTVNGQKAKVTSRENVGLQKIVMGAGYEAPYSMTEYQWVEDSLEVTPHVFADGSIGLETKIKLGSKSKPEGVIQTSIITERNAEMQENRIVPGDSLVIAGIRKSTKRNVIRGVPFLADIPIIGILFSSKDYEESAVEVIFILTPSISSGGIEYAKMAEDLREKYATPEYEGGLQEIPTDPFVTRAYTEEVEEKAAQAEADRLKAQMEKDKALEEVSQIKQKLLETAEKAKQAQQQVKKAMEDAEKAQADADKAKAEAEKEKTEAQKARAAAEKAKAEAEKIKAEAEKAPAEENKTNTETE